MKLSDLLFAKAFGDGKLRIERLPNGRGYSLQIKVFGVWIGIAHATKEEIA